jgi:hypothetical protein
VKIREKANNKVRSTCRDFQVKFDHVTGGVLRELQIREKFDERGSIVMYSWTNLREYKSAHRAEGKEYDVFLLKNDNWTAYLQFRFGSRTQAKEFHELMPNELDLVTLSASFC